MSRLKTLLEKTISVTSIIGTTNSDSVDISGCSVLGFEINADVNTPSAKTFIDGTQQVQTVASVPDSAGSLNNKYFTLQSINKTTGASKGWYVWFNINSAGVDPAVAGRTAIPITGATGVTANTLATSIRSALDALTDDFATSGGSNANIIITCANPGVVTAAADGTAATGFTFSAPSTPGVNSNVNPVLDQISITSHGFITGLKGQLTAIGTLPAGLAKTTDYFVIVVDSDTISLADSLAHALAGTVLDITDYGTTPQTCTFTPTSIAGASAKLQQSNDGSHWVDLGSATNITVDASFFLSQVDPVAKQVRVQATLTAGSMDLDVRLIGKGIDG